ncbi:MAG: DUF1538 domain-containing protein [Clostridia bacterium]|nr:DUF1538 domain-containing protein [Clostridia bacterium]
MWKALLKKLAESTVSVLPVTAIVLILNFTPLISFSPTETVVFICCALALILGMALFNLGADIAMTPMGEQIGSGLSKSGKFNTLLIICLVMGVFITIAEPDLTVLARQVGDIVVGGKWALIIAIGMGVGIFLVLSILKVVFKISLSKMLTFFYALLFSIVTLLIVQGKEGFLPLGFDSGGVTTGPITVPFIMALGLGVSTVLGDKRDRESSFGFIALCSIGPIIAVMILGLTATGDPVLGADGTEFAAQYALNLGHAPYAILDTLKNVAIALAPIVVFFFVLQAIFMRSSKRKVKQIIIGIFYTYFGLVIFLSAVEIGFTAIGFKMGYQLANAEKWLVAILAFVLGLTVVLAEPAIHVLNKQVETVTGGAITKRSMLIALSVGVGVSIALSVIRVFFSFSILYYLVPGYILSLGLSFFVPKIYTAIAFDSGGVASGPLTSTFILPFVIGLCFAVNGDSSAAVLTDAFGIVAMVAMTPLITIQTLGFRAVVSKRLKEKISMRRILDKDDQQIIKFM